MTLVAPGKPSRKQSFNADCNVENQTFDLYTCPANCRAEVEMLMIVNAGGNTTVTVVWNDASKSYSSRIVGGKNMGAGEYLLFTGASLVLEAGDKLQITPTGNSAPHIDGLCTVMETFIPVG
jgi:hypothetical protein